MWFYKNKNYKNILVKFIKLLNWHVSFYVLGHEDTIFHISIFSIWFSFRRFCLFGRRTYHSSFVCVLESDFKLAWNL